MFRVYMGSVSLLLVSVAFLYLRVSSNMAFVSVVITVDTIIIIVVGFWHLALGGWGL